LIEIFKISELTDLKIAHFHPLGCAEEHDVCLENSTVSCFAVSSRLSERRKTNPIAGLDWQIHVSVKPVTVYTARTAGKIAGFGNPAGA